MKADLYRPSSGAIEFVLIANLDGKYLIISWSERNLTANYRRELPSYFEDEDLYQKVEVGVEVDDDLLLESKYYARTKRGGREKAGELWVRFQFWITENVPA